MKKLLLISAGNSSFHEPMLKAFKHFGFEVKCIDYRGNPVFKVGHPAHRLVGKMPGLISNAIKRNAHKQLALKILHAAKKITPDYVFFVRYPEMDLKVLDQLSKIAVTMNYYPETMDQWDLIKTIAPHYTYFLNYDSYVVDQLKKENIGQPIYVPFSADVKPDAQWSAPSELKYDITFIGTYYKKLYAEREDILNAVKDLGLNIWGNKAWLDTSLKDYYRGHPSIEEMAEIYKNTCIGINADISTEVAGTGVNLRPFEVTAAGVMLLNRDDRQDIFNLFEDGKEFVSFHGVEDVRQKVEYYIKHRAERDAIAKAGFERTKREHTYINQLGKVFDLISDTPSVRL